MNRNSSLAHNKNMVSDYPYNSRLGRLLFCDAGWDCIRSLGWVLGVLLVSCGSGAQSKAALGEADKISQLMREVRIAAKKPIYQYYYKIPRVSGVTNDSESLVFELQIELGYEVGDKKTLERLSQLNTKIAGRIRYNMARKSKVYLQKQGNYPSIEASILNIVNQIIAPKPNDQAEVKDVIIADLLIYDYR